MDATASGTPTIQYHNTFLTSQLPLLLLPLLYQHSKGGNAIALGNLHPGEFPLAANPSIVLHVLTACNLDPQDLAKLEATCSFFRQPANFAPDFELSISELAALDMCQKRGQLGHGTTEEEWRPRQIRSLQGIRIVQAAAGAGRTMLISDAGKVYAFGKDSFGETEYGVQGSKLVTTPQLVESLKDIFVVQAAIGNFFTAVLSREGRVYTFSWGNDSKLGHQTEPNDVEPHPLLGALENVPVVQIAAGYCYLLALACQPNGMSVYSVGCGLGGKLGHGSRTDEKQPRLIEQFQLLNLQPMVVAAGAWHAAVVGQDGRVCTWGWGRYGCLGHGNEECESVPKVVEALSNVKAVHVATGDYTTFVVSDDGDVYSFGCGESASLGHSTATDGQGNRHANVLAPELVTSLKQVNERVVQISLTNSIYWNAHTFALTESGKLYAFGAGDKGQLGIELVANQTERGNPEQVDIDLR
ncbi:ultraviolet-B receptor UVR8 [Prunus yedoensis var. nudiflora]|uniref:Ultraviolet-B receptor UVR8 n=1 Tax=Prunus yedoensis var. nudiflora TaxID=2094558 RepID=A0A314YJS9_PRUYE|nr:ultraviolet-B receptor UVR8 [Prunus yedoensis var. nudiflora]